MSKHRTDLTKNTILPSTWVNSLMEFISALAFNVTLAKASATTLSVAAAASNAQAIIGLMGVWRYNTATVTASHPGGAAGVYDVFLTGAANDFSLADPADATNYAFGLVILPSASVPGTAVYRQIGQCVWDGSAITEVRQLIGVAGHAYRHRIGGEDELPLNSVGPNQIQSLAWQSAPFLTPGGGTLNYQKDALGWVNFRTSDFFQGSALGSGASIATLPVGYRPPTTVYLSAFQRDATGLQPCPCQMDSAGSITSRAANPSTPPSYFLTFGSYRFLAA